MPGKTNVNREGEPDNQNMVKFEELFQDKDDAFMDDRKKRVGGYILGKTLGEGSFAKVRHAVHIATNEKVAVKVINKKMIAKREYVRKNMRREAVMMQRLAHPNIVQLIEVMETENSFYLVTELAEGGDFMKYLTDRASLNEAETRKFMRQIVSAMDHMHRSGVLHRDLKIENLLLDADMNMKVIDFGLSNHWDGETLLATQCGSPAYAAPEIFGKQHYGPEVDVWSIGINMFAMLTGRLPFLVDPPNNLQKLHALILRGAKIPDYLSKDCQDLLNRLLQPHESTRITLEEMLYHPWLNDGCMPMDHWGLKVRPTQEEINPEAVWYMVQHLNVTEEGVRDSVINFKPNATTGSYFVLCQRLRKGIGLPNGAKYPHSYKLAMQTYNRKSTRNSKNPLSKDGSLATIQLNESKKTVHKTQIYIHNPSEVTYSQNGEADYGNTPVQNEHTNGYTDSSQQHSASDKYSENSPKDESAEVIYENLPHPDAHNHAEQTNGQTDEDAAYQASPQYQQVLNNLKQNQQKPVQYGSNQNVSIQREKATPTVTTGRETPVFVNQQVYDIRDVNTEFTKRPSLPDIPLEISLTPRNNTYRDSMRVNAKKKRPRRERSILKGQEKASSVPDHLNVLGSSYKQRPGQLADSIALRNTRYKLKYNSKPEDLNHIGRHSSKPEGLNQIGGPYAQHYTMDPGTVLHGTHQLTPAEHAQMEGMRARELLQKQTVDGYDYPGAPPSTTQTPRKYGYVTPQAGNKYLARDRTQMYDSGHAGMDERDRSKTMPDFDPRRQGPVETHKTNGAHNKENLSNHISNVGYYTIAENRQNVRARPQHSPHRTDPTKYQSPFVRKDSKRVSGKSKDFYHEFLTPRGRNPTNLAQVVSTQR